MLSLSQLRKADKNLSALSDAELEELRLAFYEVAELAFDVWQTDRGFKNPIGLFPNSEEGSTLPLWTPNDEKPE